MTTIHIQRQHRLSHAQLREQVTALAEELQHEISATYEWDGDTLHFSRAGASGTITLAATNLDVKVKLGLLLRPLKGSVEKTINEYLDEHLA